MEKLNGIISSCLTEDGALQIYHDDALLCEIQDGRTDLGFIEDVLYGMGYEVETEVKK